MDRSNPNWKFTNNHMVVITSNTAISMFSWKYYLENNWYTIIKENMRLLILGGIHGNEDGKLGPTDQLIENQTLFHINKLKEEKEDDIKDFNITINYECVGDFLDKDTWQPKPDELVKAIVKHQPTVLLLAFCYTSQSILNEALKSQGIYSVLIMQNERDNITKGRCIFLDKEQQKAILSVAKKKPKLVLLKGNFGTGKTILLMEIMRIKIAQLSQTTRKIRVIVTSDPRQEALIAHIKNSCDFEKVNMSYYSCLQDIPLGNNSGTLGQVNSLSDLNQGIKTLAENNKDEMMVLLIDEFFFKSGQNWNTFEFQPNLDLIVAFHPRKVFEPKPIWPVQENKRVLLCTLERTYRNSSEVLQLCSFISNHSSKVASPSGDKRQSYPPMLHDQGNGHALPPGKLPVWIEVESNEIHPLSVLKYIKLKHLKNNRAVSFIIDDSHTHSADVREWLSQHKYQKYVFSQFAQEVFSFEHSMRGLEDEVVVLMCNTLNNTGLLLEAITRARCMVVCVTTKESSFRPIFELASDVQHGSEKCGVSDCPCMKEDNIMAKEQV